MCIQPCPSSGIVRIKRSPLSAEVENIFSEAGAVLKGHFQLTSGLHSAVYWEKFRVLQRPDLTEALCKMIARQFENKGIQVVAGPTLGGIIVAYEVARQLGVRSVIAEREGDGRTFRRGFTLDPGERVLVVDDVLTTGTSILEVIAAVREFDGLLAGIGVLVDRSQGGAAFGVPFFSCHEAATVNYTPEQCPLCAQGIPLANPGGLDKGMRHGPSGDR